MRSIILILSTLLLLGAPAVALAQDPTVRGYPESDILGEVGEVEEQAPAPAPAPEPQPQAAEVPTAEAAPAPQSAGELPFTGLEVGLIALMGAALLLTGITLRRASTRGESG